MWRLLRLLPRVVSQLKERVDSVSTIPRTAQRRGVIRKILPGLYVQRPPPPPPPLPLVRPQPSRAMWDESPTAERASPIKPGSDSCNLRSNPTCPRLLLRSRERNRSSFLPISAQASNTAFRPGVQRPAIAILPNIHKLRDIQTQEVLPPA